MRISYHGWSGISVTHGTSFVGFDLMEVPPPDDVPSELVLCVSHGHPDHFSGLKSLADRPADELNDRTHVVSSWPVLQYVADRGGGPRNLHALDPGSSIELEGTRIGGFEWEHMSLLPPGTRSKLDYLRHLIGDPLGLGAIAVKGFGTPLFAPMLGFAVTYGDGETLVNYCEGLHRRTRAWEVRDVERRYHPDVVCFAVEPEDLEDIPAWLGMLNPRLAVMYEAHRPWRERFSLPFVDLDAYADELRDRLPGLQVQVLSAPGDVVDVESPG